MGKKPLKCAHCKVGWDKVGCYMLVTEKCSPESLHVATPVITLAPTASVFLGEGADNLGTPPTHLLTYSPTHPLTQPRQQSWLLWQPSIHPRHSGASESMPVNIMHGLLKGSDILNSGHFSRSIHPRSAS